MPVSFNRYDEVNTASEIEQDPGAHVTDECLSREIFFKTYVWLIAYLVVVGWFLSHIKALNWLGLLAGIGFGLAIWQGCRRADSNVFPTQGLREALWDWPVVVLAVLMIASAVTFPPTMLDSLSYRLPRMLLWLQQNQVYHVSTVEDRINDMPQVWELASMPFAQISIDTIVWIWNFVSWIVLYTVVFDWTAEWTGEVKMARRLSFIACTSTFAVLQAGSTANDLFLSTFVLLCVRFAVRFEKTRRGNKIIWSLLSLCLAAGTKPHFSVLGLPWLLWFFFSPSRPWRHFSWKWLPVLFPVFLLCSPLMSWILNWHAAGTIFGANPNTATTSAHPVWNVMLGAPMLVWQAIQPIINPFAADMNHWMNGWLPYSPIAALAPRFTLRQWTVTMVDNASIGLVHSILFLFGAVLALKHRADLSAWPRRVSVAGLAGALVAMMFFLPTSIGRSSCGFLLLSLPLVIQGWLRARRGVITAFYYIALLSALATLMVNPGRPLWPVRHVRAWLTHAAWGAPLVKQLDTYLLISERARAGEGLLERIPRREPSVVGIVGEDRPLLPLFRPYNLHREVVLMPPRSTPDELLRLPSRYVVLGANADKQYSELSAYLQSGADYELVQALDYTSKISIGPETWRLYRKRAARVEPEPAPGAESTESSRP